MVASFMVEGGLIAIFLARDARWSAWRIWTQTTAIGAGLLLASAARAWDDWDGGARSWLLVLVYAGTCLGAIGLHAAIDRRVRAAT